MQLIEGECERRVPPSPKVVAVFPRYRDARAAVAFLADRRFPIVRMALVARDMRVMGRTMRSAGYEAAALAGAIPGATAAALMGVVLTMLVSITPAMAGGAIALAGVAVGTVVGVVVGVVLHALSRAERDAAEPLLRAERYELVAEPDVADAARQLLTEISAARRRS